MKEYKKFWRDVLFATGEVLTGIAMAGLGLIVWMGGGDNVVGVAATTAGAFLAVRAGYNFGKAVNFWMGE